MIDVTTVPTSPGCYIYKNKSGIIIYIGKAKNLKKRVASYFQKKEHDAKTKVMVQNIDSMDVIATDTEVEALILENTLVKKHMPKYNIDLKDSKTYAYIQVTDEEFPRLLVARKKTGKGNLYGPFTSGAERDYIIMLLRKVNQIRTCKRMPKKACLRSHIKLCSAPCIGNITKEDYNKRINDASLILRGKTEDMLALLTDDMQKASENQEFERAILIRDQLGAIEHLSERQKVERNRKYDEDIINYIIRNDKVYLMVFNIYKGTLTNKSEYSFDETEDFFDEFLIQYYSENVVPKEIIIPHTVDQAMKEFLENKRKKKVTITIPKVGEKKQLLTLVEKNLEITFFGNTSKLEALQKVLRLQETPDVIECFDISHLSGSSTVGSMVQFRNAKPDKTNYRRFKIRTVSGIDDFKSIAEVVHRRYKRLKQEQQPFPNLIVIDGGKGQLSSALKELEKLDLKIPIISIAKRLEEIFVPGLNFSIQMKKKEKVLQFIQEIRDEAHRFAIKYNRLRRSKEMLE
jgi:excinuclease ABC subunit C